jgi:MFS family permease
VRASAWFAVWLLMVFYVCSFFARQIISLLVDPLEKQLGLTEVQLGLLIGFAFTILFTVGGVVFGWMVDTYSRKQIIFWGTICWSLSCIACAFASSFNWLFAARVGVGVGEATLMPAAYAFLSDTFPRHRLTSALGIFSFGAIFGVALSLGLGGSLLGVFTETDGVQTVVGHFEPWQAAFAVSGLPGLFFAWFAFFLPETLRTSSKASRRFLKPLGKLFARRPAVMFAQFLGFSMNNLMGYTLIAWAPTMMGRVYGWRFAEIGPALGLTLGVSGTLATLGGGFLVDRLWSRGLSDSHYRFSGITLACAAPLGAIGFLGANPWMFLGGVFAVYFASALCLNMGATSLQLLTPPALRGRMSGLYLLSTNLIGAGSGPVIVAYITQTVFHDKGKVGLAMAIVIPLSALIGALTLWCARGAYARAVVASTSESEEQFEVDATQG